jgi:hypothetical protein
MDPQDDVRDTIDREVALVEGAMRMVASGASPGMTVGGLRFGEDVIAVLRPAAAEAGIVLDPLFPTDETGCDVHVRRADG